MVNPIAASSARKASRRGWWLTALLGPQLFIGAWLIVVPDRLAFGTSQLLVLAHVVAALVALPLFAAWLWRHAAGRFLVGDASVSGSRRLAVTTRHLVALVAVAAFVTGVYALWTGQGTGGGTIHAVIGMLVAAPLALHLLLERRRAAAALVAASGLVVLAVTGLARVTLHGRPLWPETPAFDFAETSTSNYTSAAWCGECHVEIYDEWKHSTHALALKLPTVRDDFRHNIDSQGPEFVDAHLATLARTRTGMCSHCHAPLTFYGDDNTPLLDATAPVNEGITCSFCHTLRGLRRGGFDELNPLLRIANLMTDQGGMASLDFYRSGPATVRRYFGQASDNRVLRTIGNWLIRWRPEMHRHDYATPFLRSEQTCKGCHGINQGSSPQDDWQRTQFSAGGPGKATLCQDCHMVRGDVTGKPTLEPGRLVSWGAVRPQRRSHFFAGGNVRAAENLHDPPMVERERRISRGAVRVSLSSVASEGNALSARITVDNTGVGHRFPNMETKDRYAWTELSALDADGHVIARTPEPEEGHFESCPTTVFYMTGDNPGEPRHDSRLPGGQSTSQTVRLDLGAAATRARRIQASVHIHFDREPIAVTAVDLPH